MSQNVPPKKDCLFALALAKGASITAAAEELGVNRKTLHRKLQNPEFRKLVAQLRSRLITQTLGRMAENMTEAADSLAALLKTTDERLRLRTCRAVLSLGVRLHDSVDLAEQMATLQHKLDLKRGVA